MDHVGNLSLSSPTISLGYQTAYATIHLAGGAVYDAMHGATRTTFVTALQNNGYTDGIIENVIGHVGSAKMLRHYKSKAEMKEMLAAMDSVSY